MELVCSLGVCVRAPRASKNGAKPRAKPRAQAACGRQLCVRCAGPVRAKAALAAAPEAEEGAGVWQASGSEPHPSSQPFA